MLQRVSGTCVSSLLSTCARLLPAYAERTWSNRSSLYYLEANGTPFYRDVRLCSASSAPENAEEALEISERAVERLKELMSESQSDSEKALRVTIEGGGCSGFQYKFSLDNQTGDDRVFEREGVRVVCDSISFDFIRGATVDFKEDLIKSAFQVVNNPNSEASCGCGSSFVAKMD